MKYLKGWVWYNVLKIFRKEVREMPRKASSTWGFAGSFILVMALIVMVSVIINLLFPGGS